MADAEATRARGGTVHEVPVVIVGGGPVGLVLAMFLDRFGVRSLLLNSETVTRWQPKGSTHNSRTMEHYRALGIAKRLRSVGLPADYPTDVGYFTRLVQHELRRIAMPTEREKIAAACDAPATDQVPEPIFRCNQMYVEELLLEHARALPGVDVRFGWTCIGFEDRGDQVISTIEEVATGCRETVRSAWLAGCDGARGITRRELGIRYEGEGSLNQRYLGGSMVTSHARAPDFYRTVTCKPCWQYWTINTELISNIIALNGRDEFIMLSKPVGDPDRPEEERLIRRFQRSIGREIGVEFLGHWSWTAGQALVAESFGAGRVLLAGDAVHLFTPTGGFGMNTGIDDAVNLAWKLAAMVQGWGGPGLSTSYEAERKPIAARNTGASRRMASNIGRVPVGDAIEAESPAGAAARREAGAFLEPFWEAYASIGVQLGARYDGSPIIAENGSAPPPDDPHHYGPTSCPGGRAPHVWLPGRISLFDRLGPGFTVLCLNGDARATAPLVAAARARGVPIAVLEIDMPEARGLYECDYALVRPDQVVAWSGDRVPEGDALIARVTGW